MPDDRKPARRQPAAPAKLWAGRFIEATNPMVDAYTSSLDVDRRMAVEDVRGSIAHARMLAKQDIIPDADAEKIIEGLMQITREIVAGPVRDGREPRRRPHER